MSTTATTDYHKHISEDNPLNSIVYFFSSWRKLGLASRLHIQVACFWMVLVVIIGYGPIYLLDNARSLEGYIMVPSQYRPELIIVTLSYFVIILANFLYLFDIYRQGVDAGTDCRMLRTLYFISLLICVCCIVAGALAVWWLHQEEDIERIVEKTELFTLAIFAGFFVVDMLMLIAKVTEIRRYRLGYPTAPDPRELRFEKRFIFNQMILIDIPVLLGVLFIAFFAERAFRVGFYFTAREDFRNTHIDFQSSRDAFELFRNNFSAGAIGMHVIFSQFIFIMLNTRALYRKIREKMAKRAVR